MIYVTEGIDEKNPQRSIEKTGRSGRQSAGSGRDIDEIKGNRKRLR
jgi:hypothetical protein